VPCILAASILAACDRRESAWRDARRENSHASYQTYLEQYPTGVHATEARAELAARREAEEWTRAERLGTPEAWQRYLAAWPDGRHAEEAKRLLVAFIPPPRPAPVPAGGFEIQLGAWSDEALARAGFERVIGMHTSLAGVGLRLVGPGEVGDALWRLRAGPLDEEKARSLCSALRSAGSDCAPVPAVSAGDAPP